MADVPGNSTTGVTITVGTTITNEIETVGDHDWFRLQLTAGQKVSIALNVVTLEDPYLYIRNASGTVLGENDDGGGGAVRGWSSPPRPPGPTTSMSLPG